MFFSTTTEYAIRGLSELAGRAPQAGRGKMLLEDLVVGTTLPYDFMCKVFRKLVRARILESAKGRGGGFNLSRPAHEITLSHIVAAVDGDSACDGCVLGLPACNDQTPCAQHDLFKPIRQRWKDYLHTTTLADLVASLRSNPNWRLAAAGDAKPT